MPAGNNANGSAGIVSQMRYSFHWHVKAALGSRWQPHSSGWFEYLGAKRGAEAADFVPSVLEKRERAMMYDHFDMHAIGSVHMLVLGLILIIPFWRLFSKAGYSGWWSLLMVIPLVNLITLYVLAFSDWPALRT
jgi:hypothetical protein